jgi:hypothetical protein
MRGFPAGCPQHDGMVVEVENVSVVIIGALRNKIFFSSSRSYFAVDGLLHREELSSSWVVLNNSVLPFIMVLQPCCFTSFNSGV